MRSRESEEMYLETILLLAREKGQVRHVDIAETMNVSKPSVTFAMRGLTEKGYVCADESGGIRLTDAEANACRMEHVVSNEMTEVIRRFMNQGPVFS